MFNTLKKLRDVECVKMKEASNALKAIKALKKSDCSEVVLAEKILLETELKYKLIVNKIRDVNYSNLKPVSKHSASITLSNFQYELKPQSSKKNKFVTYFVLAVSNGTDLQMSKIITAAEDKLLFNEQFLLADFDEDFNIEVKVYSIKLDATKPWITSFFQKEKEDMLSNVYDLLRKCKYTRNARIINSQYIIYMLWRVIDYQGPNERQFYIHYTFAK
nr:uncharacterized protein LOC111516596 [Leptinotarsa decemlineata]